MKLELAINLKTAGQGARANDSVVPAAASGSGDSMTSRRIFLAGIASLVATPLVARAQPAPQSPRGWRIGFLRFTSTPANAFIVEAFRRGLRELGYVEGQNVTIEYRTADGKPERLLAAVSELLELNVDVIVTAGTQATLTAKTATRTG